VKRLAGALGLALLATAAGAVALAALLQGVADNARAPSAVRADVTFVRGDTRTAAVLLAWRDVVYLETAGGFRALVRPGKAVVARDRHPVVAPLRAAVPDTDVLVEELPFAGVPLEFPQIHDEGPEGIVVGGAPATRSLYVLIVRTIDPDQRVVTVSKYYKDDIATLFKFRRDRGFVQVDGHSRPTDLEVQDFVENSTTRVTLRWTTTPELPHDLFTPKGLRAPSGLTIAAAG